MYCHLTATQTAQYEASHEVKWEVPTNHTDQLLLHPLTATEAIFKSGFQYYKAAVFAPELVEADLIQTSLFDAPTSPKSQQLMQAVDRINHQLGAGAIQYGAVGLKQEWQTRLGYPSQRYTTQWEELPIVKA